MSYVIACGDEGVQINQGTRLGFVGAGLHLDGFSQVVPILKTLFGSHLVIASSQENDWLKAKLDLQEWEQVNASAQQQVEALADREGLEYAGYLPFADPKQLTPEIKGHMVRPQGVHIANKICFTLAGGEQTYNLGNFVISVDWVAEAPKELVKQIVGAQVEFYEKIGGGDLIRVTEENGTLGAEVAAKNLKVLKSLGFVS